MRKSRRRSWACGGLALVALAPLACGVKAPILALDGVKMANMNVTGASLEVRFHVRNPNPEPLRIERMEYDLFINGDRVGRGYDSKGLPLEGFGEGRVDTRVDVSFLGLPGAVHDVLRQDRVKARVKGHFYTSGHYGDQRLGFDADAEVKLRDRP
jgi:LEA14-like dessication related protein